MIDCLSYAKLVIFGGSFLPHLKGHNVMEAAQFGCRIITGRFVETFAEIINEMTVKQAIIQCDINGIRGAIAVAIKNEVIGGNAKTYVASAKPDMAKILTYFA
jgi:3-deoxy-D-manno-octulosonic-acid transferase